MFHWVPLFLSLLGTPAQGQTTTCPTRPAGDNSNACASTAFVQSTVTGPAIINLAASTAPSSICTASTIATAFSCDMSHQPEALGLAISGAATLTQPTSGYQVTPNLSASYLYLSNSSGWNNSTSSNAGRTGAPAQFIKIDNYGQGDTMAVLAYAFVSGAKPGATSFLANPAVGLFAGQSLAGSAGVYLQGVGDINLTDNGYDVAAIGHVINFNRTNNTGALGAGWGGIRYQSVGSKPVDYAFSLTGLYNTGVDFTATNFGAGQAAMALAGNQRIYLNAVNSGIFTNTAGGAYVDFNSTNSCIETVVGLKNTTCPDLNGHVRVIGGTPTFASGGGTSPSITGTDVAGRINTGSSASTTITYNFATSYNAAPYCVGTSSANTIPVGWSVTTTQLTFTYASVTSLLINYICYAQAGG